MSDSLDKLDKHAGKFAIAIVTLAMLWILVLTVGVAVGIVWLWRHL
jgi:hypothetical protein